MNKSVTPSLKLPNGSKKLLLHTCCAPCSSAVIEALMQSEIDFTIYYYNPNIHPVAEYLARKNESQKYATKLGITFIDDDYDPKMWFQRTRGLEFEPERGKRCTVCFDIRLAQTARYAAAHGYQVITSTLGISRWKNLQQVNECGLRAVEKIAGVTYWDHNWRKNGGSTRTAEITKAEGFYRQEYCGCAYSLRDTNRHRKATGREIIQPFPVDSLQD
ncbi:epoxyqueuosine reductase QueH [Mixta sp. Marseille-Q2659]|uniref:epoxyqueuosine reductase QueH n=1 Tax=Mixta sp. Marseille-Q2659 TaxID=2736607 RepID=UPI0023B9C23C|nr:epoxyqueuosine reductase QueH [Mixta sp. Marseille-Q2659]